MEAAAVDAGFHGEDAAEAPLIGGDAQDQIFLRGADGLEAVQVVVEEDEEFGRVLVEEDVLVCAQTVKEAVAAGGGLACGGARAGGFLGIAAVGFDSGLAGLARFVWSIHQCGAGGGRPVLSLPCYGGGSAEPGDISCK